MKTAIQAPIQNSIENAVSFVPELITGQLAIVDLNTLQRITSMLSTATFYQVREQFIEGLKATKSLEEMVDLSKQEVAFHETCNMITTYTPTEKVGRKGEIDYSID